MNTRLTAALLSLLAPALAQDAAAHHADAQLRVLLVANDPAAPTITFRQMAKPRTFALYRERTAAWEALLRYHFEHVTVVHGADYEVAMSDAADVTIFDTRPKVIAPPSGPGQRPAFLPASFDRPAILIAENAPLIGEPIGLKLDWL